MSLLDVEELEAGYGDVVVVRGVSFSVEAGQVAAILGPNGAGKTTMLRAVSGIVRPRGRVRFDGRDVAGARPERIARLGIAHVPEGRGTFAGLTVEENLRVGAFTRRDRAAVAADVDRCLGWFPALRELRHQRAGSLSGGEQQMLAVGRALMLRPRLMLLDEPSLGLGPIVTRELFGILGRIAAQEGTTLLIVEQNARLALRVADHAHVLEAGRVVLSGAARELNADDAVRRSYLGY